eukprot:2767079-Pleurochrysis_carterae.AAC.2
MITLKLDYFRDYNSLVVDQPQLAYARNRSELRVWGNVAVHTVTEVHAHAHNMNWREGLDAQESAACAPACDDEVGMRHPSVFICNS